MKFNNLYPTTKEDVNCLLKEIKSEKNLETLITPFEEFLLNYSCKPNRNEYPYPNNDVIDENKSVKWNREEKERLKNLYLKRVKELNTYKNLITSSFEKQIIKILARKRKISIAESSILWVYAYNIGHSNGIRDILFIYEDIADMYADLLKTRKEK